VENESEGSQKKTLSRRKQKTKQKNLNKPNKVKLNEAAIRADLEKEDAFITSLLMFLPRNLQSEALLSENTVKKVPDSEGKLNHMKETRPELFGSETRAQNYTELRQRVQNKLKKFNTSTTTSKKNKFSKEEKRERKKLKKKEEILRRKEGKLNKQNKTKADVKVSNGNVKLTPENKPHIEKEGKIVFSKFDFSEKKEEGQSKKPDYHQLLKQIEENKAKVADLKEKGEHHAVVKDAAWDKALNLSEGKKVLDDPELIKKSIKKKKDKYKKSKEKWEKRVADQQNTKDKQQQKRQSNLKAKKDDRKARNLKKLRKHGRLVPGFS